MDAKKVAYVVIPPLYMGMTHEILLVSAIMSLSKIMQKKTHRESWSFGTKCIGIISKSNFLSSAGRTVR